MRRASAVLSGLCVLAMLLLPGTAAAQTDPITSKTTGHLAHAFWTTFPADGNPAPGVVYTNTAVFASDYVLQIGSFRHREHSVVVYEFRFTYDEQGTFMPLLAINGRATDTAAFTVSIERDLSSAFAQATVQQTICTPTSDSGLGPWSLAICGGAWNPREGGDAQVAVTLTAAGDRVDLRNHTVVNLPPCLTIQQRSGDAFRSATATGSFAGRDLGSTEFAVILDFRSGDVFVEHTPQASRDLCAPPPPPE